MPGALASSVDSAASANYWYYCCCCCSSHCWLDPAANLFHELSIAHEILSDPTKRDSFDKLYRSRQARKERFSKLEGKRKTMQEDLVAREEAYKRMRKEEKQEEMKERLELERLRSEGEELRKKREKKQEEEYKERREEQEAHRAAQRDAANGGGVNGSGHGSEALGPLDTTLRLKWLRKAFPTLETSSEAISSLLLPFTSNGATIDSIVLSTKMASNPKLKNGTAVVALKTLSAAVRVMEAAASGQALKGIEVTWAAGKEPAILARSRAGEEAEKQSAIPEKREAPTPTYVQPLAKAPKLDEDSILNQLRARERERERMEEEIRRQDEEEEAAGR